MKSFTDEDLKRLHAEYDGMGVDKIDALIARLEAAEACAGLLGTFLNLKVDAQYLLSEWRKASGKND